MLGADHSAPFGRLLQEYRLRAGLTQEVVSERAGLGRRSIQGLERGENRPRRETVSRLAQALGLSPEEQARFEEAAQPVARRRRAADPLHLLNFPAGPPPEATPPHNLAAPLTSFIGRQRELAEIKQLLASHRLVTLTGPGGCGKTRLALQAARDTLDCFADGVFFVSLAPVAAIDLLPAAIARVLGVAEVAGRPLLDSLTRHLRDKRLLLLLDSCEHLVEAAPALAALLADCGQLTVLTTSRVPFRIYGERILPVPPMALPAATASPDELPSCESVRLFVERAAAVRPDFALTSENATSIAEICRRLDGLPLAIELAAARVPVLSPAALLARMDRRLPLLTGGPRDAPARQQTMRDTIAWSYDLLDADEQALFRRLALFRGCTLEAAEAVCGAPATKRGSTSIAIRPLDRDVVDGVAALVEKSLLRREDLPDGQPWYTMLETVREFARERLAESGEAPAIERRHILHYLKLAETADAELQRPRAVEWHGRIEREHDNLRAALDASVARGYAEPAFRLALALWWFWMVHGHASEGRQRLGALLGRFPLREPTGPRVLQQARVLDAAGTLASIQRDYAAARSLHEEGLALRRSQGQAGEVHNALEGLITASCMQGDYAAARGYAEELLANARATDDVRMVGAALYVNASVLHEQGAYAEARAMAEASVATWREVRVARGLDSAYLLLAIVVSDQGDHAAAREINERALALYREHGDRRHVGLVLANLGRIATALGDFATAREQLVESLAIQRELGDIAGVAFVLERFAAHAAARADYRRAVCLAGAAATLREATGSPLSPGSQARFDAELGPARQALGEIDSSRAWAEGRVMTLDAAVALALAPVEPEPG